MEKTFMKQRLLFFVPLCLVVFFLCSCGSTSATTTSVPTATHVSTPTPTPAAKTADQLIASLKSKGQPIGESFVYTASNDENHLLGRPNQYISKANWIDARITATHTGAAISVSDGGSVETFGNLTDANTRFAYIQQISKSSPLFAEYEYQEGTAILRVSSTLTPDEAKAYDDAFKKAVSQ
jgi:hypothetical protein